MSFGIGKSGGIAILVSPKFSGKIIRYVQDTDGRILRLLVDRNSFKFNIICVYAPNTVSDRKLFFNSLHTFFLSIVLILTLTACILIRTLARTGVARQPLSPISALLISFVSRIRNRSLSPGLIKIFPRLLASIASIFLPLFYSQFAEIRFFLVLSLTMILSIYLFLRLMFLCTEAVFGNLIALFSPITILLIL